MTQPSSVSFVFFGTSEFSVAVLDTLKAHGYMPALVVTQPDRPVGRKQVMTPPPVKEWAAAHDIEVLQPVQLSRASELDPLYNSEWDLFVVASYGLIIPNDLLEVPRHGALNVHPSILPKYRGASPVRSMILADDREGVGVTIMRMDEKMDHGPIVAQATVALEEWPVPARMLEDLLAREGGALLSEAIPEWIARTLTPEEQSHADATFTKKIAKEDGEIDLMGDPYRNFLKYCAYDGWPGVFFFDPEGKRVKITEAAYEHGAFIPLRVIPEGKKEVDFETFTQNSQE